MGIVYFEIMVQHTDDNSIEFSRSRLYGISRRAQQFVSVMSLAQDFGILLQATVHTDATAALGIAYRRGVRGKSKEPYAVVELNTLRHVHGAR